MTPPRQWRRRLNYSVVRCERIREFEAIFEILLTCQSRAQMGLFSEQKLGGGGGGLVKSLDSVPLKY